MSLQANPNCQHPGESFCTCKDVGELGNVCSLCGCEYDTCLCPGPTQDGMEYETFHGVLMARPILGGQQL